MATQERTQDFLNGGAEIFIYLKWPVGCEKSILRKLFTMLEAFSVLPHSKKL